MKKTATILTISAIFAATSAMAFDFNKAVDDHKTLAKQQVVEKAVSDKSTGEMVDEHKNLAKSHFSNEANKAIENSETVDKVNDTVNKVNTIKGLFQ